MAATKTAPRARARKPATPLDHLQHALEDLDHARKDAGGEARDRIDTAVDCVRDAVRDFRGRGQDQVAEWEKLLERETDEVLIELGKLAVRMQRNPAALRELSAEIRSRKAELTPGNGAGKRA